MLELCLEVLRGCRGSEVDRGRSVFGNAKRMCKGVRFSVRSMFGSTKRMYRKSDIER